MDLTRDLENGSRPRPKTVRDTEIANAQEQFVLSPNVEKLLNTVSVSGKGSGDGLSNGSALLSSDLLSSATVQSPVSRKQKPSATLDQHPPMKHVHSAIEHDHTYAKTSHG